MLASTTGYVPSNKMIRDVSPCGAVEGTHERENLNFYFVFTSLCSAMERQRCFVCLKIVSSPSCTQTLRMSCWETWENWRKMKLTMTRVGADDVPDSIHDNLPVIPDQHDLAHEGNNEDAADAAGDMLNKMDAEEQADAEDL